MGGRHCSTHHIILPEFDVHYSQLTINLSSHWAGRAGGKGLGAHLLSKVEITFLICLIDLFDLI